MGTQLSRHEASIGRIGITRKGDLPLRPKPAQLKADPPVAKLIMIGRRLRAVREAAGVTQGDLCDLLGVKQSTYSKWERGVRLPDVLVVAVFAARFRATLDFIYRGSPVGLHPELLDLMLAYYPKLVTRTPRDTAPGTDTALAAYRVAIEAETSV